MARSDLPPYRRIADDLRAGILSGTLRAGEKLKSENELKDEYGTTRVTVRKALALLKADGLLTSEQGRGVFVRPRPKVRMLMTGANFRRRRATGLSNYTAEAIAQGGRPEQRIMSVETIAAPVDVAARLGVAEDSEVIVRRRAFFVDDEPTQLVDGYYPAVLFAGTAVTGLRRIPGGVSGLIEDQGGPIRQRITQFVEDLDIRMPTPAEVSALRIPPGVPLAHVLRTAHTANGLAVEVLDSRIPCDRHAFRYVIDVP